MVDNASGYISHWSSMYVPIHFFTPREGTASNLSQVRTGLLYVCQMAVAMDFNGCILFDNMEECYWGFKDMRHGCRNW
jgi:hypothetical protein